jgi:hypothetical protein
VALEHVARLDHVVVDADQDHVVDAHPHPRARLTRRAYDG